MERCVVCAGVSLTARMGVGSAAARSRIGGGWEIPGLEYEDVPSPSIIASLSLAIEKSPSALTAVTFGSDGMVICSPGRKA